MVRHERARRATSVGPFPKVDDFRSLFPKVDDSQARPSSVSPGQLHSRTLRHRLLRSHLARIVARNPPPLRFVGRVGATFLLLLPPSPELLFPPPKLEAAFATSPHLSEVGNQGLEPIAPPFICLYMIEGPGIETLVYGNVHSSPAPPSQ